MNNDIEFYRKVNTELGEKDYLERLEVKEESVPLLFPDNANEEIDIPEDIISSYHTDIKEGDIRLLSAKISPEDMIYIAVLQKRNDDLWLVAPFSPCSYPLHEGEILIGEYPFAVLQTCMATTLPTGIIRRSWKTYKEIEIDIKMALEHLRWLSTGKGNVALEKTGLPIGEFDFMRQLYLDDQQKRWLPIKKMGGGK